MTSRSSPASPRFSTCGKSFCAFQRPRPLAGGVYFGAQLPGPPREPSGAGLAGKGGARERSEGHPHLDVRSGADFATTRATSRSSPASPRFSTCGKSFCAFQRPRPLAGGVYFGAQLPRPAKVHADVKTSVRHMCGRRFFISVHALFAVFLSIIYSSTMFRATPAATSRPPMKVTWA